MNDKSGSGKKLTALFESGNTRLHFALWDGSAVSGVKNVAYPSEEKELGHILRELVAGIPFEGAAACSVSNRWKNPLLRSLHEMFPGRLHIVRTPADIPVEVDYDDPVAIGVDRVLAAYAAYAVAGGSCVVVDAGTAVTVDAVGQNGTLLGGFIFPGLDVIGSCLSSVTDLPVVKPSVTCAEIGHGTISCMANAATVGFTAAIEGLIRHAFKEIGENKTVVITGGGGQVLKSILPFETTERPYLTLEGLGRVADILPLYR